MGNNALAQAIASAARTGKVDLVRGKVAADGVTVAAMGGHYKHYRRIGSLPAAGDMVMVLIAGPNRVLVFTDPAAPSSTSTIDGGTP